MSILSRKHKVTSEVLKILGDDYSVYVSIIGWGDDVTYYVRGENGPCEITEKQMTQELTDFIENQVIPGGVVDLHHIGRLCAEYIGSRLHVDDIQVHIPNVLSRTLSANLKRRLTIHEVEVEANPKWFQHFIVAVSCIPNETEPVTAATEDDYSYQYTVCTAASETY